MNTDKQANIAQAFKKFMKGSKGGWWKLPAVGAAGLLGASALSGSQPDVSELMNASPDQPVPFNPDDEVNRRVAQRLNDYDRSNTFNEGWRNLSIRMNDEADAKEQEEADRKGIFDRTVKEMTNYGWEYGGHEGPVPYPDIGKESSAYPILQKLAEAATFSPSKLNDQLKKDKSLDAAINDQRNRTQV